MCLPDSLFCFPALAALKECEGSGLLWAEAIELEPRTGKKARTVDALKRCEKDPHVIMAAARSAVPPVSLSLCFDR
jgi:hypothetical protein